MVEGLNILLVEAKRRGDIKGATITDDLAFSHMLLVDNILLFYDGSRKDLTSTKGVISLFEKATNMQVNIQKSTFSSLGLYRDMSMNAHNMFPFQSNVFDEGLKYLGFHMKPNDYKKVDWIWVTTKI